MKTYSLKAGEIVNDWRVLDATDRPLGRLASEVATLLKGKHKPEYSPHLAMGDFVVVINAARVRVTGRKLPQKKYFRHTGYPGGLRETTLEKMLATHPTRVVEYAVNGMLPHNSLGRQLLRRLKVYAGPDHPHEAQVKGSEKRKAKAATAPEEAA